MTRLYGWGNSSQRVEDYVPDVRFERSSIIATLGVEGINAPMTYTGTLNGDLFRPYIEQVLAPTLETGDIVIMDNCSVHKVDGILDPIYARGAKVLFLPAYSPDLNPIEMAWSKIKSILRKLKPRNSDDMLEAIKTALDAITKTDIENWFAHHGYFLSPQCVNA